MELNDAIRSLLADLRSPLSFFATIMAKNMTMAALDAQFRNNSMLSMVAEYLCRFPNIQRPASDLLCREFPIDHSTLVTILVTLAFTLLVFVAVVGNLLVMWIIGWHKVMHRGFNYFLFNLAFADFLIALLNVCTTWTYNFYYDWWFGGFCAFNQYFGVVPTCVSVFTMMVVSWDRCLAVVNPLRKRHFSNKTTIVMLLFIWMVASTLGLPTVFYSNVKKQYYFSTLDGKLKIQRLCVNNFPYIEMYDYLILVTNYILPLIVLSVAYTRIAHSFRKSGHNIVASSKVKEHLAAKRRVVKMLALIVAIFMICWLPYQLYFAVLERYIKNFGFLASAYMSIYWLAMSASAYNPIIYCYMNKRFRTGFKYAFRWLPFVHCSNEEYRNSGLFRGRSRSAFFSNAKLGGRCSEMSNKPSTFSLDSNGVTLPSPSPRPHSPFFTSIQV